MVVLKWIVIVLVTAGLALLVAGQLGLLNGSMPTDLGVRDGRLKAPSLTNNSVSSQAGLHADHPQRGSAQIAPLALRGDGPATMARLGGLLQATPGVKLVHQDAGYVYAQCTTPLLKFVDDLELWFDPAAQVVQVRSASRVGREDMGVNRRRVEALRAALAAAP